MDDYGGIAHDEIDTLAAQVFRGEAPKLFSPTTITKQFKGKHGLYFDMVKIWWYVADWDRCSEPKHYRWEVLEKVLRKYYPQVEEEVFHYYIVDAQQHFPERELNIFLEYMGGAFRREMHAEEYKFPKLYDDGSVPAPRGMCLDGWTGVRGLWMEESYSLPFKVGGWYNTDGRAHRETPNGPLIPW